MTTKLDDEEERRKLKGRDVVPSGSFVRVHMAAYDAAAFDASLHRPGPRFAGDGVSGPVGTFRPMGFQEWDPNPDVNASERARAARGAGAAAGDAGDEDFRCSSLLYVSSK